VSVAVGFFAWRIGDQAHAEHACTTDGRRRLCHCLPSIVSKRVKLTVDQYI